MLTCSIWVTTTRLEEAAARIYPILIVLGGTQDIAVEKAIVVTLEEGHACAGAPDKTIATLLVLVKVHHFLLRLDFLRGQIGPFPLLINKEGRALYNCHSRCAFVIALFVS